MLVDPLLGDYTHLKPKCLGLKNIFETRNDTPHQNVSTFFQLRKIKE
jgi:hypothetical protein